MYDYANNGSSVIVFIDAGGFGGIAYALNGEYPNNQQLESQIYCSKASE